MTKSPELSLTCSSPEGLHDIASRLLDFAGEFTIFALYGEMGAGKTTFIKALCKALGVRDEVSSPTFSLVNEYADEAGAPVFHFDFYRMEDETEAMDIGLEEYLDSRRYCFMEWCEKIPNLLPLKYVRVSIHLEDDKRIIKAQKVTDGI